MRIRLLATGTGAVTGKSSERRINIKNKKFQYFSRKTGGATTTTQQTCSAQGQVISRGYGGVQDFRFFARYSLQYAATETGHLVPGSSLM
jgi:hypothetical protein